MPRTPAAPRGNRRRAKAAISFEDMAARRAERLVNLVICLLSTRQYLTAERIRGSVPGYEAADGNPATDEAFKRMFERDKAELRDLGIPLETGRNSHFDTEEGYRISRRDYELPPLEFDPAEAAAVGLAGRLWQSATLGESARLATIKLRAAGIDVQTDAARGALPQLDASDPNLAVLLAAARVSRPVRFEYLKSGAEAAQRRVLEPWGVLSWRGRWYVAGFDRDRDDARSFRLSRIIGAVTPFGKPGAFGRPADVDLVQLVAGRTPERDRVARVAVSGHAAGGLRRLADVDDAGVLTIRFGEVRRLARQVAAAGASAVVLEPPDLLAAVHDQLRRAAGLDALAPSGTPVAASAPADSGAP